MKIFEMAVSCIDTSKGLDNNTVIMKKSDILKTLEIGSTQKYTYLNKVLRNMVSQGLEIQIDDDVSFYAVTTFINYKTKGSPDVILEFNPKLMPYLIELKENFTQYKLKEIVNLQSKYAVVLYKWCVMNYQQGTYNASYYNPKISMKDLRILTDTTKELLDFRNFEKRVLKLSQKEINEKTDLHISYEKVKDGRSIGWIQFYIEKKDTDNVIDAETLQSVTDETYTRTYGKHNNVFLTDSEISEITYTLRKKWAIDELSEWKFQKKITVMRNKSDYDLIKKWNQSYKK